MQIGLCMIVKDEQNRIIDCLDRIIDLLDDVVTVDTGSRDDTPALLKQRFSIEVIKNELDSANCNGKTPARNLAYRNMRTPWILSLDADERIARTDLQLPLTTHDDEVSINFRMQPWLLDALEAAHGGRLHAIRPYAFAY